MKIIEAKVKTIEQHTDFVSTQGYGTFSSKETRDLVASQLRRKGKKVIKWSSKYKRLHPEYVSDFVGEYQTGFGNTDYMTVWPVLYKIEIIL